MGGAIFFEFHRTQFFLPEAVSEEEQKNSMKNTNVESDSPSPYRNEVQIIVGIVVHFQQF
jgi:hypothetical protein